MPPPFTTPATGPGQLIALIRCTSTIAELHQLWQAQPVALRENLKQVFTEQKLKIEDDGISPDSQCGTTGRNETPTNI